ncbi:MAG: hypothetical protein K940chlam7_01390 [Chlamydiae bacterium]|nr:hypothetical protein [Chlamydiota bacterium]
MTNIPKSRIILYLMIAGLLPFIFVAVNLLTKTSNLEELQNTLEEVKENAYVRETKQSLNMTVRGHYKEADHFYIDKHLETLSFLKPEIESLQKLVDNKYYAGDENVKKRLELLTGTGNALLFSEGSVEAYPFFQETTATLVHPVEVNLADLQKMLSLIEGVPVGPFKPGPFRPQLIFLEFKIDKKEASESNEIFLLNMKLLKREYL